MQTVAHENSHELEIKKSTFKSFLVPIEKFDSLHVDLKEIHPKANHIVWAKRYLNEFNQIVENCSDDGEPKGTSGPPILNVMRGTELIECGILVVRYFGGTKLGTGGLVRAYGGAAKEVIAHASLLEYIKKEPISFFTQYGLVPRFEHFLEKNSFHIDRRTYEANGIIWHMNVSQKEKLDFLDFALCYERDGFNVEEK
ncbi:YigZ family protein [Sulfurospirillum arcachonense]|uniref:YigZ family protein n=1 Tax=Sulfurospirillum arcachonense TaxID=57666 RepID=UPI0004688A9E|nr:YigZ family protein [Sulfurospirillum arcachonense]